MSSAALSSFIKRKDFLFCADSDGCAMDTMTSKHETAFCPRLIDVYGLEECAGIVTEEWLRFNLYSATRGVNRFKGLAHMMGFLREHGVGLEGADEFLAWVASSAVHSNDALRAAGAGRGLQKALEWSLAVNETIAGMGSSCAFEGCEETLAAIHGRADTAVVSAANGEAVHEEWERCGLAPHMDLLMGQEAGSKAFCLTELARRGYAADHILMAGDALGDLDAAQKAGVLFYPILVGREAESWVRLRGEGFPRFLAGTFAGEYQERLIAEQRAILR